MTVPSFRQEAIQILRGQPFFTILHGHKNNPLIIDRPLNHEAHMPYLVIHHNQTPIFEWCGYIRHIKPEHAINYMFTVDQTL